MERMRNDRGQFANETRRLKRCRGDKCGNVMDYCNVCPKGAAPADIRTTLHVKGVEHLLEGHIHLGAPHHLGDTGGVGGMGYTCAIKVKPGTEEDLLLRQVIAEARVRIKTSSKSEGTFGGGLFWGFVFGALITFLAMVFS